MPLRSTRSNLDYLKRYILDETFDEYRASRISRRDMLRRVLVITGSIPLTASLVSACTTATPAAPPTGAPKTAGSPALAPTATSAPKAAASPSPATRTTAPSPSPAARTAPGPSPGPAAAGALTVAPNDPAIEVRTVEFAGPGGTLKGYLAQPRGVRQAPGILVIHENRGLDEHHQDVARRYAKDGFVALAVDLLSRRGGSDRIDPAQATGTLGSLNQNDLVQDLVAYADYLKNLSVVAGPKVGAVGYCYGGGLVWQVAINSPNVGAAVPYYGAVPQPVEDVETISGPVLAIYAENDRRINAGIEPVEAAMRKSGKSYEKVIYPGANHGFNNDTRAQTFNADAARDAYQRSVAFFKEKLAG